MADLTGPNRRSEENREGAAPFCAQFGIDPAQRPLSLLEYRAALRRVSPEDLRDELGLSDNYPIFLRTNFRDMQVFLASLSGLESAGIQGTGPSERCWFEDRGAKLALQINSYLHAGFRDLTEFEKEYNVTVMLHPQVQSPGSLQRAVEVLERVIDYIIENQIPAYFLYSRGRKEEYLENASRDVKYP